MGTHDAGPGEPVFPATGQPETGPPEPVLFILAFDHRSVLNRMYAKDGHLDADQVREMKSIVVDAVLQSAGYVRALPGARPGILLDEETGGRDFPRIRSSGIMISTPIERSGAPTFVLDHGDRFLERLGVISPDHAKALVFLNPESGPGYLDQVKRLADALASVHRAGHRIMLEVVVPPTAEQLARVAGNDLVFDQEIRPALVCRTITDCYGAGMRPELWKLEGFETAADYAATAQTIRSFDPDARSIVLGRGADEARVNGWLTLAAATAGFAGFAIGRSIWDPGLRSWSGGECSRGDAVAQIAGRYRRFADLYHAAARAGVAAQAGP